MMLARRSMNNRSRSTTVPQLVLYRARAWARSRAPWLWLALLAAFAWYTWDFGGPGGRWWTIPIALVPFLGFLAGFDTYARMRESGGLLRLVLLQPVSRHVIGVSFFITAGGLAWSTLALFFAFLLVTGNAPLGSEFVQAAAVILVGCLGFVAYAQLGSLLLHRDALAVLGLLVIFFGSRPFATWLPTGTPEWIVTGLNALEWTLPTAHRIGTVLAGQGILSAPFLTVIIQMTAVVALIGCVLGRQHFLVRSAKE